MGGTRLPCRKGRPRTRPRQILSDEAYSSPRIRAYCRRRGIRAVIPHRKDELRRKRRGRPPGFDKADQHRHGPLLGSSTGTCLGAEKVTHLTRGDFQVPALSEATDDLQGPLLRTGAEQGLRLNPVLQLTQQHTAGLRAGLLA